MSWRRTMAITARLLAQFRHDHRTLGILFAAPLVILGIFALLLGGGGDLPGVGVVNADAGPLGSAIVRHLDASDLVDTRIVDAAEAEQLLTTGELAAYVTLPEDMTAAVMQGGALDPDIHLRGTEPSESAATLRAVQQAMVAAASELAALGGLTVPELAPVVSYRYGGADLDSLDLLGGPFVGLLVFFIVYLVTSVSFLRERSLGTLERLMASPLRRTEIVVGYSLGFSVIALLQAAEILLFSLWILDLYNAGSVLLIFLVEALLVLGAVNLGILLSTFARSEFQAVQFIPVVISPQILLSGVIVPVSAEPGWLQVVSNALPLTYAVEALRAIMLEGADLASEVILRDVAVLGGFTVLMIVAAAATLRRRVA